MEIALGEGGPQLVQYLREGSTLLAKLVIRRSKECFLRNGSGTLAPSPAPEPFPKAPSSRAGSPAARRPTPAPGLSLNGRASAMQRSRSAIVLEVITVAAVVALVVYVLFPPN